MNDRKTKLSATTTVLLLFFYLPSAVAQTKEAEKLSRSVTTLRVPNKGIQPQCVVDDTGTIHLIYFKGNPRAGNVFYVKSKDGKTFSSALQVNSGPNSVVAAGTIRGAHIAIGKNNRVHVAWMGSKKSKLRAPGKALPMLYTRLKLDGSAFEPQRNIVQFAVGLDGGGSVAADKEGNVYVAWHADPTHKSEANRRVYIAKSTDDGKTFSKETKAFEKATGACGCCGMRAFADSNGNVMVLYRGALNHSNRDMYFLHSNDKGKTFKGSKIHPWKSSRCVMSTSFFAESNSQIWAAWETKGNIWFGLVNSQTMEMGEPIKVPGKSSQGKLRKNPVVVGNKFGETIVAWTEGTSFFRGGSGAWQVFDNAGKPTKQTGSFKGVQKFSVVAVLVKPNGGFVVVY